MNRSEFVSKGYKNKKKGQVSSEFIVLNAVLLLLLLFTLHILSDDFYDAVIFKESNSVRDLGYSIQNEFLMAANVKDGYHRTFTVPVTTNGYNFTIQNTGSALVLVSGKHNIEHSFLIPEVTGNIQIGANKIIKTGGVIYLN